MNSVLVPVLHRLLALALCIGTAACVGERAPSPCSGRPQADAATPFTRPSSPMPFMSCGCCNESCHRRASVALIETDLSHFGRSTCCPTQTETLFLLNEARPEPVVFHPVLLVLDQPPVAVDFGLEHPRRVEDLSTGPPPSMWPRFVSDPRGPPVLG